MSSIDLLEVVNSARKEFGEPVLRTNVFSDRIKDELEGEHYKTFVVQNLNNTESTVFELTFDQCMLVGMRESKGVRRKVLEKIKAFESKPAIAQPEPFRLPTPIETKAQLDALQAVMSNDELKKCAPLVWQHLSDALQNQALAFIGVGMLPAPSSPGLLDVVEIAKRNGIDLPANLRSSAGKYVKARVQATEVERIVNGSTRRTSAYSDHAAVAECIRQYLDGRK